MKNTVFHKHEKFHWSIPVEKREICIICSFHLSKNFFLRSFMNMGPALYPVVHMIFVDSFTTKVYDEI